MTMAPSTPPQTQAEAPLFRFPLTATQSRSWFLEQLSPGNTALNVAVRWELKGAIRDETVEAAFAHIVERHEILRTRFTDHEGVPRQEVLRSVDFRLPRVDLRPMAPATHAARLDAIAVAQAAEPFDLGKAPLLRVTLVRTAPLQAMLLITAHQSVFDGFSIGVLGEEFGAIASALEAGRKPSLPELPLQYGDYALWQHDYLQSEAVREDAAYWKKHLGDAPYFEIEPDFPRPAVRGYDGAEANIDLPASFGERLEAEARRFGMTGFAYGAAILSAVLYRRTNAPEVMFGTHIAGRNEVDLEKLIGVFINNLVLRFPTSAQTRILDHLAVAKRVVEDSLLHQNMPFNKLVELLNPPRDRSRTPVISISFDIQRTTFLKNKNYGAFELISRPSHSPGAFYDMNFAIIGRPDSCRISVQYNTGLFSESTAYGLLEQLVASFELAFANPDARLSDLPSPSPRIIPLTSDDERVPEPMEVPSKAPAPLASSTTEARLALIWSEILDLPPARCKGDFFDIGGHSLLAVRMLARVRADFGVSLALGAFIETPTFEFCARLINEALARLGDHGTSDRAGGWLVTTLQAGTDDGPLLITVNHPLLYFGMKGAFSPALTILNVSIPDLEAVAAQRALDFDSIVGQACDAILERCAGRPLALLGLCVNGRVALRLAQRLTEAGERVDHLLMIDTYAPRMSGRRSGGARVLQKIEIRRRRWLYYVGQLLRGELSFVGFLGKNNALAGLLRRLRLLAPAEDEIGLIGAVTDHLVDKTRSYAFAPYGGETLLFRSGASTAQADETLFDWQGILPEDTPVYAIKGWHEDALLQAGLERLACILMARLARTGGR